VLGMHRSGTSALTGMLHHLGVALGERLMPASPDNPRGYWEHNDIVDVDHRLMATLGRTWDDMRPLPAGFERDEAAQAAARDLSLILNRDFGGVSLWGLKDPRLCRLMPLWTSLLAEERVKPRFLLALRHPLDVAASLAARDGLSAARAGVLWLGYLLAAERATRGKQRAIVHYEDLVGEQGWRGIAALIADEFGIAWPRAGDAAEAAVDDFLTPELRRNRAGAAGKLPRWIEGVYGAFRAGELHLDDVCDAVGREFAAAGEMFLPIFDEESRTPVEVGVGRQGQNPAEVELTHRLNRARHEAAETRDQLQRVMLEVAAHKQGAAALAASGRRGPQPLPVEEAFPRWVLSRRSIASARDEWVSERVGQWEFIPTLGLGMILPAGSEPHLALTLRSLGSQITGNWLLHVVAETEMPAALAEENRVVWHCESAGRPVETMTRYLQSSDAHWVALIDAGDQLAPHTTFAVADAFFRHPADPAGAAALRDEQHDQQRQGQRDHERFELGGLDLESFDRAQHRDRRGQHAIAVEQRGAEQPGPENPAVGASQRRPQRQHHQRQDAALAAVVGAHQHDHVLDRDDQGQRPGDQRQDAVNPRHRDHRSLKALLDGVERRRADIAINHAERGDREALAHARFGGRQRYGCGRRDWLHLAAGQSACLIHATAQTRRSDYARISSSETRRSLPTRRARPFTPPSNLVPGSFIADPRHRKENAHERDPLP
jgi:hypothetical protein